MRMDGWMDGITPVWQYFINSTLYDRSIIQWYCKQCNAMLCKGKEKRFHGTIFFILAPVCFIQTYELKHDFPKYILH